MFLKQIAFAAVLSVLSLTGAIAQELREPTPERFERWGNYADKMEIRLGVASYDTGLFAPMKYDGVSFNGEVLFRSPEFLSFIGSPRPYIGFDTAIVDDPGRPVSFGYAGLNWTYNLTSKFYLSGSLGGSVNDARNLKNPVRYKGLGCNALFHLGAAVGYDITSNVTVQAYANHFSNANLCKENDGAETAGVRVGVRW